VTRFLEINLRESGLNCGARNAWCDGENMGRTLSVAGGTFEASSRNRFMYAMLREAFFLGRTVTLISTIGPFVAATIGILNNFAGPSILDLTGIRHTQP